MEVVNGSTLTSAIKLFEPSNSIFSDPVKSAIKCTMFNLSTFNLNK